MPRGSEPKRQFGVRLGDGPRGVRHKNCSRRERARSRGRPRGPQARPGRYGQPAACPVRGHGRLPGLPRRNVDRQHTTTRARDPTPRASIGPPGIRRPGMVERDDRLGRRSPCRASAFGGTGRSCRSGSVGPICRVALSRPTAAGCGRRQSPASSRMEIALTELIADIDPGPPRRVVAADSRPRPDHHRPRRGSVTDRRRRTARLDGDAGPVGRAATRPRRGSRALEAAAVTRLLSTAWRTRSRASSPTTRCWALAAQAVCLPPRPNRCARAPRTSWLRVGRWRRARSPTASITAISPRPRSSSRRWAGHPRLVGRLDHASVPGSERRSSLAWTAPRHPSRRPTTRWPTPISVPWLAPTGMSARRRPAGARPRAHRPPAPRGGPLRGPRPAGLEISREVEHVVPDRLRSLL
jgi:hypothetical protein